MNVSDKNLLVKTANPVEMSMELIETYQLERHKQLEILFVLEGSVNLQVGENGYRLEENDIVVINRYELHGLFVTLEQNTVLKFQMDADYYDRYYPRYSLKKFICNSASSANDHQAYKAASYEKIRQKLAMLAYQWQKKEHGYQFEMGVTLLSLAHVLALDFESDEDIEEQTAKDLQRLVRILDYIDDNFEKGIDLKEIAAREGLNFYYLSTFIKRNLGISFQDYVNMKRMDKVLAQLAVTDKSITDIALESGFSTTKSLNLLFNKWMRMTPSEFRKKYKSKSDEIAVWVSSEDSKRGESPINHESAIRKLYSHL